MHFGCMWNSWEQTKYKIRDHPGPKTVELETKHRLFLFSTSYFIFIPSPFDLSVDLYCTRCELMCFQSIASCLSVAHFILIKLLDFTYIFVFRYIANSLGLFYRLPAKLYLFVAHCTFIAEREDSLVHSINLWITLWAQNEFVLFFRSSQYEFEQSRSRTQRPYERERTNEEKLNRAHNLLQCRNCVHAHWQRYAQATPLY